MNPLESMPDADGIHTLKLNVLNDSTGTRFYVTAWDNNTKFYKVGSSRTFTAEESGSVDFICEMFEEAKRNI